MSDSPEIQLVRDYFAVFQAGDRASAERILADHFTFTSPVDDRIDRASYFERCWPNHRHIASIELERMAADGDEVFVRYLGHGRDGAEFRNTECFTIQNGRISQVHVFFGTDTTGPLEEREVAAVVGWWADGIRCKDVDAVEAQFARDPVNFFLAPPLQADVPIRLNLTEWFATFHGPLGHELRDLRIVADGGAAFCHCLVHLTGARTDCGFTDLWFRLTLGLRKLDGRWKILHAHESIPFLMDGSGRAALDLKP